MHTRSIVPFARQQPQTKSFLANYLDYVWQVAVYIIRGSDEITPFKKTRHALLLLWIIVVYILESFFTGDMISAMATQDNDLFIDSWDDLLARTEVDKVAAFNYKGPLGIFLDYMKISYFPPGKYYALTNRLEMYNCEILFRPGLSFVNMLHRVSNGEYALMYHKTVLELYASRMHDLHISRTGGFTEPYFLLYYVHMPAKIKSALNDW